MCKRLQPHFQQINFVRLHEVKWRLERQNSIDVIAPALLDGGTLEVDARVEEGVVHPRDGAAVGVAVQLLVALAALKNAMRIFLD